MAIFRSQLQGELVARWPSRPWSATATRTPGDTALLIALGAGLSYAGQVVKIPPVAEA
jgi:hypothetical protein